MPRVVLLRSPDIDEINRFSGLHLLVKLSGADIAERMNLRTSTSRCSSCAMSRRCLPRRLRRRGWCDAVGPVIVSTSSSPVELDAAGTLRKTDKPRVPGFGGSFLLVVSWSLSWSVVTWW